MKNILIIGNSSIISKEISSLAVKKKFNVISTYFSKKSSKKNSYFLDLTNENSIEKFYKNINNFKFDIVVICSATQVRKNIESYNKLEINKVLKTNVIGISYLINKIINSFKKNSTLIVISSSSFLNGGYDVIYNISKSLLSTLGRSLSKHYGYKFKTIMLLPGLIDGSNQMKKMKKNRISYHKKNTPVKKLLSANDVGKIIFDLHEKHWLSANGSEIRLDGGYRD